MTFRLIFAIFKRKSGYQAKRSQPVAGFLVVMLFAKRLPIALIPEKFLITPVRYDMIDYRRRGDFVLKKEWILHDGLLEKGYKKSAYRFG